MDNSELRGLLADLAKDDPRPRLAGVLEIRAANYLREHGARLLAYSPTRLLADSDELAELKARIAGAAVGECTAAGWLEVDGESMCGFFVSVRDKEQLCRNPFGQRVALLPVGEGEG